MLVGGEERPKAEGPRTILVLLVNDALRMEMGMEGPGAQGSGVRVKGRGAEEGEGN